MSQISVSPLTPPSTVSSATKTPLEYQILATKLLAKLYISILSTISDKFQIASGKSVKSFHLIPVLK
jgi:hypothetical protein